MATSAPAHPYAPPAAALRPARVVGVGVVVFLANAGLLALQLAADRLLAPFVGSSLETWAAVIAAFLTGIALGNALGGRLADRYPGGRMLAAVLATGAVAAAWVAFLPWALAQAGLHRPLPLGVRIPVLAFALCVPPGFVLSLLTPLAVRIGTPDVRVAGRAAGGVFALSTLGCLAGNYVTGFYLIPNLTVNGIVLATSAGLLLTAGLAAVAFGRNPYPQRGGEQEKNGHASLAPPSLLGKGAGGLSGLPLRNAFAVVFLCSFAGMTLELAAARLLAQILGVSLYTWTGVIGVMLAGTALGNWLGGVLADRAAAADRPGRLAASLVAAGAAGVAVLGVFLAGGEDLFAGFGMIGRVLACTFALFFPAMFCLGTVSPQVVRLAVPDAAHAGRTAGRVYAVSTAGSIAGCLATGFGLLAAVGMYRSILLAAVLPVAAAALATNVLRRPALVRSASLVLGLAAAGALLFSAENTGITRETNYFTITVRPEPHPLEAPPGPGCDAAAAVAGAAGLFDPPGTVLQLKLDRLVHSWVKPTDPTYLKYPHEQTQLDVLRGLAADHPGGCGVLVVGGGGYTFPRCARTLVPAAAVDVVEIDPGVTAVSYSHLALDPALDIHSFHMDGRQFVAEVAEPGRYHLITLDAINDLTVPYHLLTREFHDEVKRALAPDGVYLLTVIDVFEGGRLWAAAAHTLKETFPHVEVLSPHPDFRPADPRVYVLYASRQPLDLDKLRSAARRMPAGWVLENRPRVVLTDQYAPVDNLMADVVRRKQK